MLLNVNEFLSRPKQTQLGCIFHRFTTVAGCFLDYNKICVEKKIIFLLLSEFNNQIQMTMPLVKINAQCWLMKRVDFFFNIDSRYNILILPCKIGYWSQSQKIMGDITDR